METRKPNINETLSIKRDNKKSIDYNEIVEICPSVHYVNLDIAII